MRVVLGSEMKRVDGYTINKIGIPSLVLMERAAYSFVEILSERLREKDKLLILCGVGNNGADGLAAARMLAQKGFAVNIVVMGEQERATTEWKQQRDIVEHLNICAMKICEKGEKGRVKWEEFDWVVDALFGVGLSRELQGDYRKIVEEINNSKVPVAAIDIPSGINGDTGQIMGAGLMAKLTVSFGAYKTGLLLYPGRELAGEIYVTDIGLAHGGFEQVTPMEMYTRKEIRLPQRVNYANKGTYGKIYIIGGQKNMAGAVCFSALGAYGCGAGLVKIQTVEENRGIVQTLVPQAILSTNPQEIEENIKWADVIVIGPGLGIEKEWNEIIERLIDSGKPVILDADALNLMAEHQKTTGSLIGGRQEEKLPSNIVITPHLGEMSRLIPCSISAIQKSLIQTCREFQGKHGGICVLKDAVTIVQDKEKLYLNTTGNDGMSVGGSGDVLTGMIAAFAFSVQSENRPKQEKNMGAGVKLAVYIHGLAGDIASIKKGKRSMNAMDIIEAIPKAIMDLENNGMCLER